VPLRGLSGGLTTAYHLTEPLLVEAERIALQLNADFRNTEKGASNLWLPGEGLNYALKPLKQ